MSTGPQLVQPTPPEPRNWTAIGIGAAVLIVALALLFLPRTGDQQSAVTPVSAPLAPYAASLAVSGVKMSTSSNMAGSQLTYIDGHIANSGTKTVTGIMVQLLFRDAQHDVVQNETLPMNFIRMRDPYVDVEPVSAAPLKPGEAQDFRLILDSPVAQDWDGTYPDVRLVHVEAK